MARILMTGMCSVQDRYAFDADFERVKYLPFPPPIVSREQLLHNFRIAGNTGNFLITEGAYYAARVHAVTYVPFWYLKARLANPECYEAYRKQYDFCLFVTANILNADFELSNEVAVLQALSIPTIFTSLGVQRRSDLTNTLHPSGMQFIEFLRRKDTYVFTRGEYAAEFLQAQGVPNVFQACCPSAFHHPQRILRGIRALKEIDFGQVKEIWINGYFGDQSESVMDANVFSRQTERVNYVLQDEPIIFNILDHLPATETVYDETSGEVIYEPTEKIAPTPDPKVKYYAFFAPDLWRMRASCADLLIGRRFHGNLVGLQAGRPAFFIAHDDRVREMLQSIGMPFAHPTEWNHAEDKKAFLENFARNIDVGRFEDVYFSRREQFLSKFHGILG